MQTEQLIAQLSAEAAPVKPAPCPKRMLVRWLSVTALIIGGAVAVSHLRPDFAQRIAEPLYLIELAALLALLISTGASACWLAFPDRRQQGWLVKLPLLPLAVYALTIAYRLLVPGATAVALEEDNGMICSICIVGYALAPAATLLALARRCATTVPRLTGAIALLAAATTGQIILKLIEANDAVPHLLVSHIIPIMLLGLIGMALGRKLLVW